MNDPPSASASPDRGLPLRRALAEWHLGRRPLETLPRAAVDALAAGQDTPSLARLAGMEGRSWSELRPVVEQVEQELRGAPDARETRRLVADAWLERVAAGARDRATYDDTQLANEILIELGGAYEWFRLALYDLEILDGTGGWDAAVEEMRLRAAAVLEQPVAERYAAPAPSLEERPFLARELGRAPLGLRGPDPVRGGDRVSDPAERLPRRARALWILQYAGAAVVATIVVAASAGGLWWLIPLVGGGLAAAVVPTVRYARWRYEIRDEEIDLRHGVWKDTRTLIPIRRVQHVDTEAGILQNAMDLRAVTFHTAAGKSEIPAVEVHVAEAIRRRVADLARTRDDV